ncbi:hypothetical protein CI238_00814 [Colletotrichum incanum]|uniref:Uncharacterized protein n=1 Tax=Colletotrichum incanum TaxID=1573173 RepID=A0A166TGU9_COLIC|nr:hypothetical protein CI238_00814 [Colletotrichum incanum]OHW99608.1 hypothetical protein CSPAE12_01761 [Colletotrichum incanum]
MASTTPQQGSVSTQRDARIETFLSDQALGRGHGATATQQISLSPVAAAIAYANQLGLGSGGAGAGGAVGRSIIVVPANLRGTGSQFRN